MVRLTCLLTCIMFCAAPGEDLPLRAPKHGGVYVVAHRGAHEGIPENTLAAYQKAIDLGVDFVEIDVRTTKDGRFVSIHNSTVDAYGDGATGEVMDFTLAELRALDIGSRVGPEWEGAKVPTFDSTPAPRMERNDELLSHRSPPGAQERSRTTAHRDERRKRHHMPERAHRPGVHGLSEPLECSSEEDYV